MVIFTNADHGSSLEGDEICLPVASIGLGATGGLL